MPRIRTIKPEFFVSESLAEVSLTAERTFAGLITQVDDKGRIKDNAAILHGAIWALRPEHAPTDVEVDLIQLEKVGLICRYVVNGKKFLHLVTFNMHQKISHATESKLPECPHEIHGGYLRDHLQAGEAPKSSGENPEPSGGAPIGSGSGSGSGMEVEGEQAQAPKRGRPRTPATEAPEHFGITPNLAAWAASKGIADVATPEETERFLFHHRSKGNKFSNWDAAWQKWMSDQAKWAAERASPMPPPRQNRAFANAGSTGAFDEPL